MRNNINLFLNIVLMLTALFCLFLVLIFNIFLPISLPLFCLGCYLGDKSKDNFKIAYERKLYSKRST